MEAEGVDKIQRLNRIQKGPSIFLNHSSHQKQKNLKLNEKRLSIDANTKMTEMLELFDKDCKATVTKLL